jgi:capsular polysaccharide transport system ATP-binding protein
MIRLENLTKAYRFKGHPKYIVRDANAEFPAGKAVALMGRNGTGKSTLLKLIAGTINPDAGRVITTGMISWPIGLAGCIHPELTGVQNVRFIARVYGVDTDEMVDFVGDFADLGQNYHQPVRNYSSGQKARLNFGMSMGIRFDCYLIDEVTSVGDSSFKEKSVRMFRDRMSNAGAIFVSHSISSIRETCDAGMVLENGALTYFDDVSDAIDAHERNLLGPNYKRLKLFAPD